MVETTAKRKRYLAAAVVVLVFAVVGCRPGGFQEAKLQKEPRLSLYVVETGETKSLGIEEYLAGVVAGEMKPEWPEAAYAAQAILARSFTMNWLGSGKKSRYGTDLSTDVEEAQAYKPDAVTDRIRDAVQKTRGKVMTYDGQFVRGWFHSYSGGRTATAKEGLAYREAEPPYVESIKLPNNPYVPADLKSWLAQFTGHEVKEALRSMGKSVGDIRSVQIGKKGPSGRTVTLVFSGTGGEAEVSAPDFRVAIGPERLKSLLLSEVAWQDGRLRFRGSGFGHGVGLSQWDAYMLAKEGQSPEDIVKRFFPKVTIEKRWK